MPEKSVLVIGANHLDILATYKDRESQLDNMGDVRFAVGGTAFNMACNLAKEGIPTYLLTAINPNTLGGKYALKSIQEFGIRDEFCIKDENLEEGAFVGIYRGNSLERAVTKTTIEKDTLGPKIEGLINEAIGRQTSLVLTDCNLHSAELNKVLKYCCEARKKLLIDGVSEEKSKRLIRLFHRQASAKIDWPIEVFSCNLNEFVSLLRYAREHSIISVEKSLESPKDWLENKVPQNLKREICKNLNVRYFIIQEPTQGYFIVQESGEQLVFNQFEELKYDSSSLGSGDAITSGVAFYFHQNIEKSNWSPELSELDRYVRGHITSVLRRKRGERLMMSVTEIEDSVRPEYMKATTRSIDMIKASFFVFLIAACIYSGWLTLKGVLEPTQCIVIFAIAVTCILLLLELVTPKFLLDLAGRFGFQSKS